MCAWSDPLRRFEERWKDWATDSTAGGPFCRKAYAAEAAGPGDAPRYLRHVRHLLSLLLLLTCALSRGAAQSVEVETEALAIGEQLRFRSTILGEFRALNVYLPPGYHPDSARRYPVMYVLDGGRDGDFVHLAGLTQFLSMPWIEAMPAHIVVGVVNVDRKRDFTPASGDARDRADFPTQGGAEAFARFLAEEAVPLVERRYRTAAPRTLVGQSLGGLFAARALLTAPGRFDNYLIVSPSLWWDGESSLAAPVPPLDSG